MMASSKRLFYVALLSLYASPASPGLSDIAILFYSHEA